MVVFTPDRRKCFPKHSKPSENLSKLAYKQLLARSVEKQKDRVRQYFHSPLDRIRSGINERAVSLGLQRCLDKSFELNQSFPRATTRRIREYEIELDSSDPNSSILSTPNKKMEKLRVDGANGLRFSARRGQRGAFTPGTAGGGTGSPYNSSLINSASESLLRIQKSGINPNKAVFTIDSKSSQILIVNNNACQLLGYTTKELCNIEFSKLLSNKKKGHVSALAEGQLNSEDGTMVLLSGKVVEMNTKNGFKIAVSLWIRQIDNDGRCLAVAEPVERRVSELIIDQNGLIMGGDYEAVLLFQLDSEEKLNGLEIATLIPAIQIPSSCDVDIMPKHIRKQKATGKTKDGDAFPLCLMITEFDADMAERINFNVVDLVASSKYFLVTIWVFTNISGLIVIDDNGMIESCNHHFSMLMFGYSETKILNRQITNIMPNFGQDVQYLGYHSRNVTNSSIDESETETDPICMPMDEVAGAEPQITDGSPMKCLDLTSNDKSEKSLSLVAENVQPDPELLTPVNEIVDDQQGSFHQSPPSIMDTPKSNKTDDNDQLITSTPFPNYNEQNQPDHNDESSLVLGVDDAGGGGVVDAAGDNDKKQYSNGSYKGEALHNDGNIIDVIYTISCQILPCGRKVYCVWISRDPDSDDYDDLDDEDERHMNLTLTFNSGNSQVENSLGQSIQKTAAQNTSSRPNSLSMVSQCEEDQVNGEFSEHYSTLKQIGRGAFGYVKMAYRNSDRLLVVAKFILKEKLCSQFMIVAEDNKEVPMEIYLLSTVKHPNVVTVYDVFENEKFFQLVMEKHGSGMDLFEFIDRRPMMDEKLACFIFRQIAKAVDYLLSLKILHRDIKDENIIIDQNFHVKLIDFGSATFMQEGKLFSTFFGTTEYCSPEVLAGNKYAGPELEMWSLGVTLYVLIFLENPFLDIEETLRGELRIPHRISPNLEILLTCMLDKDPKTRYTMKELMEDVWLNQEIISTNFNFANIVRCEPYEANPDKYYTGQKFSSTTLLSTTSPQDSLSLVDDDDDSIIDGDEEEDDDKSIPSQDQDNAFKLESLPSAGYSESFGSVSSSMNHPDFKMDSQSQNISSGDTDGFLCIVEETEKIISSLEIISITDNLLETYNDDDDYDDEFGEENDDDVE